MPAPKTSVLIALLSLAGVAQSQTVPVRSAFRIAVDIARFAGPDSLTHLEVYYGVSEASLTYRGDSTGFIGALTMSLQVVDSTGVVDSRQWVLPRVIRDSAEFATPRNILSFETLTLRRGEYRLSLVGADSLDLSRADTVSMPVSVRGFAPQVEGLSDIELCSRITPSGDKSSPFYRNTLEVIPNPSRLFGQGLPVVYFYAEVYNLNLTPGPNVVLRAAILDNHGTEVVSQAKSKPRTFQSSAEYGSMNIASLPGGSYRFFISLLDSSSVPPRLLASSEKKFFVYNPGIGEQAAPSAADRQDRIFAFMTEPEADDEIRKIRYLTTEPERAQIEKLADLGAKRNFLRTFWSGRESEPVAGPAGAREMYLSRIREADGKYAERNRAGWLSDRGRVSVVYGEPDDVERHPSETEAHPYEIWEYRSLQAGAVFIFVDNLGFGSYRLVHSTHLDELRNENWFESEAAIR